MAPVTATEARASLPELLDRVLAGEEVTITRHGQPVAVLVRPDALRSRRAQGALATADRIRGLIAADRTTPLSDVPGISTEYAEGLVADVRAGRDHERPA